LFTSGKPAAAEKLLSKSLSAIGPCQSLAGSGVVDSLENYLRLNFSPAQKNKMRLKYVMVNISTLAQGHKKSLLT